MPSDPIFNLAKAKAVEELRACLKLLFQSQLKLACIAERASSSQVMPSDLRHTLTDLAYDAMYAEPYDDLNWSHILTARSSLDTAAKRETQSIYFYDEGHARGGYWENHQSDLGQTLSEVVNFIDVALGHRMELTVVSRVNHVKLFIENS